MFSARQQDRQAQLQHSLESLLHLLEPLFLLLHLLLLILIVRLQLCLQVLKIPEPERGVTKEVTKLVSCATMN